MDDDTAQTEMLKGLMTLPVEGLKMICLINGGAVIAILTYLGNLIGKSTIEAPDRAMTALLVAQIKPAIGWYCAGLSFAVFDLVLAYFVQLAFATAVERKRQGGKPLKMHRWLIVLGSLCALMTVVSFVEGSLTAVSALSAYAKP